MFRATFIFTACLFLVFTGCASFRPAEKFPDSIIAYKHLLNADPRECAATISRVYPGTAGYDTRTNTVILRGSPEFVTASIALINRLDSPIDDDTGVLYGPIFFMKYLHHARARDLVPILEEMTGKGGFDEPHEPLFVRPRFEADERTNVLLIKADRLNEERIRKTIDELDRIPDAR
jgi:hypothetical protein